jgi:hypothetical protein
MDIVLSNYKDLMELLSLLGSRVFICVFALNISVIAILFLFILSKYFKFSIWTRKFCGFGVVCINIDLILVP